MVTWIAVSAVLAKTVVLLAGLTVLYYTIQAARHSEEQGLWLLSLGILLTGAGLVLSGTLSAGLGVDATTDVALTSSAAAVGLLIVLFSMFADDRERLVD